MANIDIDALRRLGILPMNPGDTESAIPDFPVINMGQEFGPKIEAELTQPQYFPKPQEATSSSGGQPESESPVASMPDAPQVKALRDFILPFQGRDYRPTDPVQSSRPLAGTNMQLEGVGDGVERISSPEGMAVFRRADPSATAAWAARTQAAQQAQQAAGVQAAGNAATVQMGQQREAERQKAAQDIIKQKMTQHLAAENPLKALPMIQQMQQQEQQRRLMDQTLQGGTTADLDKPGIKTDMIRKYLNLPPQSAAAVNILNSGDVARAAGERAGAVAGATQPFKKEMAQTNFGFRTQLAQQSLEARQKAQELPPAGLDFATNYYLTKGELPPMGLGQGTRTKVYEEIGKKLASLGQTPADIEAKRVTLAGLKAEQTKNSQIKGTIRPYMENLDKHIANLEPMIDATAIDGSPVVNKWIQAGRRATGDPGVIQLDNALHTMLDEYTRVVTTVTGSGQTADAERQRWLEAINSANTPEQLHAVIDNVIKKDRQFRDESLDNEDRKIQDAIRAVGSTPLPPRQSPLGAVSQATPALGSALGVNEMPKLTPEQITRVRAHAGSRVRIGGINYDKSTLLQAQGAQ